MHYRTWMENPAGCMGHALSRRKALDAVDGEQSELGNMLSTVDLTALSVYYYMFRLSLLLSVSLEMLEKLNLCLCLSARYLENELTYRLTALSVY
ncbi:hypothetical protein J6590_006055 [Homalodisca vitripennis]|nr:hypothetical protein J6590_006055 [Homalodisca vitripennis]